MMGRLKRLFRSYKTFYKVTNEEENHNGYQYKDGLNVDIQKWDNSTCSKGGIYCTKKCDILHWLEYGNITGHWVREVKIPKDEIHVSYENKKIKSHSVILGKRIKIDLNFIKKLGYVNFFNHIEDITSWAVLITNLEVLKYIDKFPSIFRIKPINWALVAKNSIKNNDVESFKYAIDTESTYNLKSNTSLHDYFISSINYKNSEIAKYILSLIAKNSFIVGQNTVCEVIMNNDIELIDRILDLELVSIDTLKNSANIRYNISTSANSNTITYFVEKGISKFLEDHYTSFDIASRSDNKDMIDYLVHNTNINLEEALSDTTVQNIIERNCIKVLRYLLDENMYHKFNDQRLILTAIKYRSVDVLILLLDTGCINSKKFSLNEELNDSIFNMSTPEKYIKILFCLKEFEFKIKWEKILRNSIRYTYVDIIECLLENDFVNIRNLQDKTIYRTISDELSYISPRVKELSLILYRYGYTKELSDKVRTKAKNKKKTKRKNKKR